MLAARLGLDCLYRPFGRALLSWRDCDVLKMRAFRFPDGGAGPNIYLATVYKQLNFYGFGVNDFLTCRQWRR